MDMGQRMNYRSLEATNKPIWAGAGVVDGAKLSKLFGS